MQRHMLRFVVGGLQAGDEAARPSASCAVATIPSVAHGPLLELGFAQLSGPFACLGVPSRRPADNDPFQDRH